MLFWIVRFIARIILRLIATFELDGWEHVPKEHSFVVAANHIGVLDPILVYFLLNRQDIVMLVAEKHQKSAFARFLVKAIDGIFIDRYNPDIPALREALKRLKRGGVLTIAPEGTRSKTGTLIEARPGGIYLALKAGVPILPVALTGTADREIIANLKRFRKSPIKVTAGPAFTLPPLKGGKDRETFFQKYTDEVMCRIAMLLPEERRGVYAQHPRLKELLREK